MKNIVNCSIYIRNQDLGPADYYRIVQYIPYLEKENISVRIHESVQNKEFERNLNSFGKWWRRLYQGVLFLKICFRRYKQIRSDIRKKTDVVFIQREIFPRFMPAFIASKYRELCSKAKVIWDYDDDIFGMKEISSRETKLLLEHSQVIQGISEYSGTLIPEIYRNKYTSLPTTDASPGLEYIEAAIEEKSRIYEQQFNIIWVGTVSNLTNIDLVINALDTAARILKSRSNKQLILTIVCNEPYKRKTKDIKIENIKWSRDLAKEKIREAHLGIMPLEDGKLQRGKGGFKLIQYLSEGVPVIASDVGFCREVVSEGCGFLVSCQQDWANHIIEIASNMIIWKKLSSRAYQRYLEKFDVRNNTVVLFQLITTQ